MTIQEVLNSGKRFSRPSKTVWVEITEQANLSVPLSVEDLLATDWEVEPTLVTRDQFLEAEKALKAKAYHCPECGEVPLVDILREVGL